jgi:Protein of unknown function (DUF3107)
MGQGTPTIGMVKAAIQGEPDVDVRIGVVQSPKEIEVEMADGTDNDAVTRQIEEALRSEDGILWLTDRRGRTVGIPSARIAYVEVNATTDERRVGFGAAAR